jgi:hypothetical protein
VQALQLQNLGAVYPISTETFHRQSLNPLPGSCYEETATRSSGIDVFAQGTRQL